MTNTRLVAYALIAIGLVALLSRLTGDSGWLWIGLVAAGFLVAYQRERVYSFLVLGSVLMGVAVGILLEGSWHWPGAFLVSLGAGVAAIDLAAPRENRWPRIVGLALIVLGVITGLAEAGVLTSSAFAVLLIAAGVVLVVMSRRGPAPGSEAVSAGPVPEAASAPGNAPPPIAAPSQEGRPQSSRAAAPHGATAPTGPVDGTDEALRAALRTWRGQVAEAEGRSEALVVGDGTIDEIVARRPGSLDELAQVYGIGPVKLERYGTAILQRVRNA
jgi:hypothetical protein